MPPRYYPTRLQHTHPKNSPMIKRTLYFSNPYYLSLENGQLKIQPKEDKTIQKTVPVEDIGFVVLDHPQLSFSMKLLEQLSAHNVAVVFCDSSHLPTSMLLQLDGHSTQNELFRAQIRASEPLKKNLWKQTIVAKIKNQAAHLEQHKLPAQELRAFARSVKSGDTDNREGTAARLYWQRLLGKDFIRDRYGLPPNHLLNYGYTLLRAAVARALAGSGLLATLGIHHHNRYNAFCLADDLMEPYRPYVDQIALNVYADYPNEKELNKDMKASMLSLMSSDVTVSGNKRPLMIALSTTTASLARCFAGESRTICYPDF